MKRFSRDEIVAVLRECQSGDPDEVAARHGVTSAQLLVWKGQFSMQAVPGPGKRRYQETRAFHAAQVLSKEDAAVLINTTSSMRVKGVDGKDYIITKVPRRDG